MKTLKCINREKRAQAEVVRVRNGWRCGERKCFQAFIETLCFLTVSSPPHPHTSLSQTNEWTLPEHRCLPSRALLSSARETDEKVQMNWKKIIKYTCRESRTGEEEANDRTKRESFLNGLFNGEYENGSGFNLPSNERNVNGEISWNFYNHSSSART